MIIAKKPGDRSGYALPFRYFPRARDAFEHVLRLESRRKREVLIPAYIGYGKVEGSGVFDPIQRTKTKLVFYRMKGHLEIDLASAKEAIAAHPESILLLIHYFGFKDRKLSRVKKWAAEANCIVVEDYAHGLFTFFENPLVDFDYAFFSLHKMLPYRNRMGGLLLSPHQTKRGEEFYGFHKYNLRLIAKRRRDNYTVALERLERKAPPGLVILRGELEGTVPESFPILLPNRDVRNLVHARMNAEGFGLISLYHQLIPEIDESYRSEREISDRITNLPIHQDTNSKDVARMVDCLCRILEEIE